MKMLKLSSLITFAILSLPQNTYAADPVRYCVGNEKPTKTNNCKGRGPFDVSFGEYTFVKHERDWSDTYSSINSTAYIGGMAYAFMQGMERYAEEMEEWYEYMEYQNELAYARQKNANRSDNVAYAVIDAQEFYYDRLDGSSSHWYRRGDMISGSDWDNDGYIDVLKGVKGSMYDDAEFYVRSN
jgi:hypothetical protein